MKWAICLHLRPYNESFSLLSSRASSTSLSMPLLFRATCLFLSIFSGGRASRGVLAYVQTVLVVFKESGTFVVIWGTVSLQVLWDLLVWATRYRIVLTLTLAVPFQKAGIISPRRQAQYWYLQVWKLGIYSLTSLHSGAREADIIAYVPRMGLRDGRRTR